MTSDIDEGDVSTVRRTLSRYDVVLAVIPAAFLAAAGASFLLSVPPHRVVPAAGLVGTLALVEGLFRNPPRTGSGTA